MVFKFKILKHTKDAIFFIFQGKNGATYISNTVSWSLLTSSFKFYRPLNLKSKILKFIFKILIFLIAKTKLKKLKSIDDVNDHIKIITNSKFDFSFDKYSSILISPTKDKVIINNNDIFIEKYYFGKSYKKGLKDLNTYKLFSGAFENFQTSKCYDSKLDEEKIISFKLSNINIFKKKEKITPKKLVLILSEFFNISNTIKSTVEFFGQKLKKDLITHVNCNPKNQLLILDEFIQKFGSFELPLGLVHGDFKPWNVMALQKPLIYDFEEIILNGLPLFDFLNFYISPIISYENPKNLISKTIIEKEFYYKKYLNILSITFDYKILLHFYLISRIIFYVKSNEIEISNKYLDLSNYLIESKWG